MANNRKLGRVSSHRKAMLRNLATDVIMHGKIETTATRAKEVRKVVDKLITLGIRGDLHITVKVTMPQWQSSDYSNHKAPMVS